MYIYTYKYIHNIYINDVGRPQNRVAIEKQTRHFRFRTPRPRWARSASSWRCTCRIRSTVVAWWMQISPAKHGAVDPPK